MRRFLARFSEPVWSGHVPSWADFITTTPELKFSVHTRGLTHSKVTRERHDATLPEPSCRRPHAGGGSANETGRGRKARSLLRRPARDQLAGVMILVSTGMSLAVKPT